jgi:hypothetical protein
MKEVFCFNKENGEFYHQYILRLLIDLTIVCIWGGVVGVCFGYFVCMSIFHRFFSETTEALLFNLHNVYSNTHLTTRVYKPNMSSYSL